MNSAVPSRFGALFVMRADGTDARRITNGRADTDPAWSPDGQEIVFVRGTNLSSATESNEGIYPLDSRRVTSDVTRTPHLFETTPTWSPDGSRIAFARSTPTSGLDGAEEIYVVNRDGTGERLVVENRRFASSPYSLAWAADGRSIAIETSSTIGCTSISLVAVGSGTVRPLTTCTKPNESSLAPAWQPRPTREER